MICSACCRKNVREGLHGVMAVEGCGGGGPWLFVGEPGACRVGAAPSPGQAAPPDVLVVGRAATRGSRTDRWHDWNRVPAAGNVRADVQTSARVRDKTCQQDWGATLPAKDSLTATPPPVPFPTLFARCHHRRRELVRQEGALQPCVPRREHREAHDALQAHQRGAARALEQHRGRHGPAALEVHERHLWRRGGGRRRRGLRARGDSGCQDAATGRGLVVP